MMTPAEVADRIEIAAHSPICPQHGLSCVCAKCCPPPCLCAIVAAVEDGDRDGLRLAFWDAAKAVKA